MRPRTSNCPCEAPSQVQFHTSASRCQYSTSKVRPPHRILPLFRFGFMSRLKHSEGPNHCTPSTPRMMFLAKEPIGMTARYVETSYPRAMTR